MSCIPADALATTCRTRRRELGQSSRSQVLPTRDCFASPANYPIMGRCWNSGRSNSHHHDSKMSDKGRDYGNVVSLFTLLPLLPRTANFLRLGGSVEELWLFSNPDMVARPYGDVRTKPRALFHTLTSCTMHCIDDHMHYASRRYPPLPMVGSVAALRFVSWCWLLLLFHIRILKIETI